MADARAFSPSFASVERAAEEALRRPDGVTVKFTVARSGSMEASAHAARSFQKTFTSLRARMRKPHARAMGEESGGQVFVPRFSDARGVYDRLVCQRHQLGDNSGWAVSLLPISMVMAELDICDGKTGEPIETIGVNQARWLQIVLKANSPTGMALITPMEWLEAIEEQPDCWDHPSDPGQWLTYAQVCKQHPTLAPEAPRTVGQDHLIPEDLGNLFGKEDNSGNGIDSFTLEEEDELSTETEGSPQ